jgi:hypothetical protein
MPYALYMNSWPQLEFLADDEYHFRSPEGLLVFHTYNVTERQENFIKLAKK